MSISRLSVYHKYKHYLFVIDEISINIRYLINILHVSLYIQTGFFFFTSQECSSFCYSSLTYFVQCWKWSFIIYLSFYPELTKTSILIYVHVLLVIFISFKHPAVKRGAFVSHWIIRSFFTIWKMWMHVSGPLYIHHIDRYFNVLFLKLSVEKGCRLRLPSFPLSRPYQFNKVVFVFH